MILQHFMYVMYCTWTRGGMETPFFPFPFSLAYIYTLHYTFPPPITRLNRLKRETGGNGRYLLIGWALVYWVTKMVLV